MYSLFDYGVMIADSRTAAYREALKRRIRPDSVVLEIGTGAGILALIAARLGARKVYAVESSAIIEFARRLADANGLSSRIQFIQGLSTKIDLPEPADIIVSDLHGVLPIFENSLPTFMDARTRFLKPGGCFIPQREILSAALVEASGFYQRMVGMWSSDVYGVDMTLLRLPGSSHIPKNYFAPDSLATSPLRWAELDYRTLDSANVRGNLSWEIAESRTVHGLCVWFDWDGAEGVSFSNSPFSSEQHMYGQAFFPWSTPVCLNPGDRVSVDLNVHFVNSEYLWRWNTAIAGSDGQIRTRFRQTTFDAAILPPDTLRKRVDSYVPALNEEGSVDLLILSRIGTGATLAQIAQEVCSRFPLRFPKWTDALTRVGELSVRYSA